jgi:putative ABC transport system ATP-binding protein
LPELARVAERRTAVELRDVGRQYVSAGATVEALSAVSLTVELQSTVAVTGPSGSGKTTLLNIIAALDRPTTGSVSVLGVDLTSTSERRLAAFRAANIGLVFQEAHLLPGLTALENVVMSRLPWGRRKELERDARGLLADVGLTDRVDHPPAKLSGGERQRVAIARALLGKPALLVADEPTGALDAATTDEILDLLTRVRRERGLTMVLATHDPAVAAIAERLVRVRGGHVIDDRARRTALLDVHQI